MAKASGAEAKGGGGKPSSSEEGDARVFLPYLPENVSEDMLKSHFGRFGKIVDIFIPHVKSSKEKRIAFITYLTHGEAMACTKHPKHIINNKTCEVVKASPKPEAGGAKGGHGGGAKAKGRK
jgi:RNA recognition motif-containing protein